MNSETTNEANVADNNQTQYEEMPFAQLIEEILSKLEYYFSERMVTLFKETDDFLFDSANSARSIDIQNRMFEFMNALRSEKENIEKNFIKGLSFYLQPISEIDELPKKSHPQESNKLSLIEQDAMDEMVTLTTISSKAAMDLKEELNHLEIRLKALGEYNTNIFHGDALEPRQICDAFQEAISATYFENQDKLILYKQFGQHIVFPLKKLYDEINQMLIEQGILPEIDYGEFIPHGDQGADVVEDDAGEEAQSQPATPAGPRRAFGTGAAYGGGAAAPRPVPAGASQVPPSSGGMPAGPRRAFGSGAAYSDRPGVQNTEITPGAPDGSVQMSAGFPLAQVRQSIQDFIGGMPTDSDSWVAATGGSASYYSHKDVVSALSNMQVDTELDHNVRPEFNANALKRAVLNKISEKHGGTVTKRVNQISEKTIDFIKLIFDAIIDDKSITDTIKTLLLSLQIPVIKAAMIDPDFFVDDKHPARQLLDKFAEAGVGVSDHTDPIYIKLAEIVQKLLKEFKEDVTEFKVALEALTELTDKIYQEAKEREEKNQKQIKHEHARNVVLQEIRKVTLGKELPKGIRTLVLKMWPSLMFNHYLKNGKANDEWVEMLMMLDKIIESVQPVHTLEELEAIGLSYEQIIDATKEKLKRCRKSKDMVQQVVKELEETFQSILATKDLPEKIEEEALVETAAEEETGEEAVAEQPVEEAAEEVSEEVEETPEQIAKRKIDKLPAEVQAGAWFIVYNGEDKPVRRLKLAVILMQDATLVFVDHLGNVVFEKDAEVFTDELEKGLSGIIMQHSVFDHALHSALQSVQKN